MAYRTRYEYLYDEKELKKEIDAHKRSGSIIEEDKVDNPVIILNFKRAENELKHAEAIFKISGDKGLKKELELLEQDTFYSGVIAHAYYAIFYATKAILLKSRIRTKSPNVHKASLDAFSFYFVINGKLDLELLKIYQSTMIKADSLLSLLVYEKNKRGQFTY